ncbi:hypothetical protein N7527_011370 [Penicillium freii]|nr:hypothetical protein N7527_011370 [Penicillium freii]
MLILNSVALHFSGVWWVLVLVCFPHAVKGPRGSTSPIRCKNPYLLLSPCSLTCAKKNTPPPFHRTPSLPPLATPFSPRVLLIACTIPRRQPQLPGFRRSSPQWLTTIQSPCHGLWWDDFRHQNDGQIIKKEKCTIHHPCPG